MAFPMSANFYDQHGYASHPGPNSQPRDGRDSSVFSRPSQVNHDDPPFSRVFVVCSKSHTADDLRATFEKFGVVEDVWVVKDKHTKENRGVAYIKFSKMSEATIAVEEMDGKSLDHDSKPIKAIIAKPKSSKSTEDFDDATALTRLFIVIPRKLDEPELKTIFEEYGEVDYVQIVKDRKTREPKGFGYVNFKKPHYAALALERCDTKFKAVMAEPKSSRIKRDNVPEQAPYQYVPNQNQHDHSFGSMPQDAYAPPAFAMTLGYPDARSSGGVCNRLQVAISPAITQEQLARLFDLIPGMELCDLKKNYQTGESKGIAFVVYNSIGASVYAKEKLNGFEYPPGYKLIVRYAPDEEAFAVPVATEFLPAPPPPPSAPLSNMPGKVLTTAVLPAPKPLADPREEVAERLFIVCTPTAPNDKCLKDVFSRFGDLIDVYMLKNKNFGYAKYASKGSAKAAMDSLNGEEIMGVKVKVLPAEPPKSQDPARKRPRT
eukprot:gene3559-4063_t